MTDGNTSSARPQRTSTLSRARVLCVFLVACLLGTASALQAATVQWNPNPESDIAGYKLSYGTQTGVYTTSIDVGNVTTWNLTLTPGTRYFVVIQAYNTGGLYSAYSAEVIYDAPPAPTPTLTSLSPSSGTIATAVTISGSNFGASKGTSTVTFNGTAATPTSWSASSIVVPVPAGATTGNVVVTVGGLASNALPYTVIAPPVMTSLSPSSGPVGTVVTVNGTNFGATQGTSTITFKGIAAAPTSWSATRIVVPIPAGATTGNVVVTVGGLGSPAVAFLINPGVPTGIRLVPQID